jgi:beta-phosphoglucomutase-like phosphatase (HAD superfamily)
MFGLPDGVSACLFDMDSLVTQTAAPHAAAWKEMFDEFQARALLEHGADIVVKDLAELAEDDGRAEAGTR